MNVAHHGNKQGGEFYISKDDVPAARATYKYKSETEIIIDHTVVDEALQGTGAGAALIASSVAWARENSVKIFPQCSFAKHQFEKHKEYTDVLAS